MKMAAKVLALGKNQRLLIDLTGNVLDAKDGICGGWMEVLLERWRGKTAMNLCRQICTELNFNRIVRLVHPLSPDGFPFLGYLSSSNWQNCFIETIEPAPTLCIVGAGHIGIQLARIASILGFAVVVQDDREEWANFNNFPQAEQIIHQPMATAIDYLETRYATYVALVTRGFHQDINALTALLNSNCSFAYVGMIGSQKRVRQVLQCLIENGVAKERLINIHAPIGIPIGATTPAEIAISIGAEIIAVKNRSFLEL